MPQLLPREEGRLFAAPTPARGVQAHRAKTSNARLRFLAAALMAATLVWIVGWHANTATTMVLTWWHSETFAHGLIIYPISAWLVWRKRAELAALPMKPCYWALLPLVAASFIGLLGVVGGVEAARQFGLVATIALAVVVVMGAAIARAIAFPLAFTLLAVPIGEFLLPILMQHTADFTVAALRLTGIPVYREGLYFTVPSGRWSVVEACSGLRYLIASLTLGSLYAYLSYTTLRRRVLFIAASIIVPIVANWLRAYMIVMIGHLSSMRLAVGVDHLIYGWVFFGMVMLLLFWGGSRWREDNGTIPEQRLKRHAEFSGSLASPLVGGALAVALVASAGPLYVDFLNANNSRNYPPVMLPAAVSDWVVAPSRLPLITPHFLNARSTVEHTYERQGRQVHLFIAYYARQDENSELISFHNHLIDPRDRSWRRTSQKRHLNGAPRNTVVESRLQSHRDQLLSWHWYWAGGHSTPYPEEVKLRQAIDRLTGRGDDAAVVVLYTDSGDSSEEASRVLLQEFLSAMQPTIVAALDAVRSHRSAHALPAITEQSRPHDSVRASR
jgi:exosortase A